MAIPPQALAGALEGPSPTAAGAPGMAGGSPAPGAGGPPPGGDPIEQSIMVLEQAGITPDILTKLQDPMVQEAVMTVGTALQGGGEAAPPAAPAGGPPMPPQGMPPGAV